MANETLRAAVALLAERRLHAAACKAKVDEERAYWEAQHENKIAEARLAAACVAESENEVRSLAIDEYVFVGDKHPAPGVDIRVTKRFNYDAGAALAWAKQHDMALALDKKAFEKLAAVSPESMPVTVEEVPTATIATNLAAKLTAEAVTV